MINKFTFSVNEYDNDGDVANNGIFFHLGALRIKICDEVEELDDFIAHIVEIKEEIRHNY